jgi:hypothetical protein
MFSYVIIKQSQIAMQCKYTRLVPRVLKLGLQWLSFMTLPLIIHCYLEDHGSRRTHKHQTFG